MSQRFWNGQKSRHLIKAHTICTTTGLVVADYFPIDGKLNDSQIMINIFEQKYPQMEKFLNMIENRDTLLVLDRGYNAFINWLKSKQLVNPEFYPKLKTIMPCHKVDPVTKQYPQKDVDESRRLVTSVRNVIENLHGWIKIFLIFRYENQPTFILNHFKILNFISASLNKFGVMRVSAKRRETFTPSERIAILSKQSPFMFESKLNEHLVDQNSQLFYRKRQVLTELSYSEIPNFFPDLSVRQIESLNGGPYTLRKGRQYVDFILEKLREREANRIPGVVPEQNSTSTSNQKAFRTMILKAGLAEEIIGAERILRVDVPSFFGSQRKFATLVAYKIENNSPKFSFACTCNCGNRFTPCVHNIVNVFIFGHKLKAF